MNLFFLICRVIRVVYNVLTATVGIASVGRGIYRRSKLARR
jgi:hypothetical protein